MAQLTAANCCLTESVSSADLADGVFCDEQTSQHDAGDERDGEETDETSVWTQGDGGSAERGDGGRGTGSSSFWSYIDDS